MNKEKRNAFRMKQQIKEKTEQEIISLCPNYGAKIIVFQHFVAAIYF